MARKAGRGRVLARTFRQPALPRGAAGAQRAREVEGGLERAPGAFQRVRQRPVGLVRAPGQGLAGAGAARAFQIENLVNRPTVPTLVSYPGGGSLYGGTAQTIGWPGYRSSIPAFAPPAPYAALPATPSYIPPETFGAEEFGGGEGGGGLGGTVPLPMIPPPETFGATSWKFRR